MVFAGILKHYALVAEKNADGEISSPFKVVKYWAK